jgi:hypothetical protein
MKRPKNHCTVEFRVVAGRTVPCLVNTNDGKHEPKTKGCLNINAIIPIIIVLGYFLVILVIVCNMTIQHEKINLSANRTPQPTKLIKSITNLWQIEYDFFTRRNKLHRDKQKLKIQ